MPSVYLAHRWAVFSASVPCARDVFIVRPKDANLKWLLFACESDENNNTARDNATRHDGRCDLSRRRPNTDGALGRAPIAPRRIVASETEEPGAKRPATTVLQLFLFRLYYFVFRNQRNVLLCECGGLFFDNWKYYAMISSMMTMMIMMRRCECKIRPRHICGE